jgi:hypothetical protein
VNGTRYAIGHVQPAPAANARTAAQTAESAGTTPRAAHEDVMRRARELRERDRVAAGDGHRDG